MARDDGARFRPLLDRLGREIVSGALAEGASETVDGLVQRTGASRSVVREATRVLVSLGMLSAGRRVGLRVRARAHWDLLDPQVIRWRLDSDDRAAQVRELTELRLMIEPESARLAAARRDEGEGGELERATEELRRATRERDRDGFLDADRRFHRVLPRLARNAMLSRIGAVIDEALSVRTPASVIRWGEARDDVELHAAVAAAIRRGDGQAAAEAMRRIVDDGRDPRAPAH